MGSEKMENQKIEEGARALSFWLIMLSKLIS